MYIMRKHKNLHLHILCMHARTHTLANARSTQSVEEKKQTCRRQQASLRVLKFVEMYLLLLAMAHVLSGS